MFKRFKRRIELKKKYFTKILLTRLPHFIWLGAKCVAFLIHQTDTVAIQYRRRKIITNTIFLFFRKFNEQMFQCSAYASGSNILPIRPTVKNINRKSANRRHQNPSTIFDLRPVNDEAVITNYMWRRVTHLRCMKCYYSQTLSK